jgi:hypothetical protein
MRKTCVAGCLLVMILTVAVSAGAQTAEKTASQFYTEYRAAFDKAKAVEEILPYMSAERRKQVESTPAAERKKMFGMIKMMGTLTDVKILKEARTADGATVTVEALDTDKAKTTGTITLVKENGAWKVDNEKFFSSAK